jgi:hypothetical protein
MCSARGTQLRLLVAALAAPLALTAGLPAQTIAPGTLLRVLLRVDPPSYIFGTLVRMQRDTLILRPQDDPDFTISSVPLAVIASVEVHQGRHGHAKTGALVGFGVGALAGAATFVGFNQGWNSDRKGDVGAGFVGGFLGGAAGMGLGALIGWAFRGDSWEAVPLRTLRVAPVALNRFGVGLSLHF